MNAGSPDPRVIRPGGTALLVFGLIPTRPRCPFLQRRFEICASRDGPRLESFGQAMECTVPPSSSNGANELLDDCPSVRWREVIPDV
ncbi:MAG: hypothetical protein ACYDHH_33945 [Solirubrobacteraceae bacterium]